MRIRDESPEGLSVFNVLEQLLVHYVHGHFKTETHFSSSWFSPHSISP